jgi:ATP-dependent Lhr-like helicase
MLKWPSTGDGEGSGGRGPTRSVGSLVVLVNGSLAAYVARGGRQLLVFLPDEEPGRTIVGHALAARLARLARTEEGRGGMLISEINGVPVAEHPLAPFLADSGFTPSAMGFQMRRSSAASGSLAVAAHG